MGDEDEVVNNKQNACAMRKHLCRLKGQKKRCGSANDMGSWTLIHVKRSMIACVFVDPTGQRSPPHVSNKEAFAVLQGNIRDHATNGQSLKLQLKDGCCAEVNPTPSLSPNQPNIGVLRQLDSGHRKKKTRESQNVNTEIIGNAGSHLLLNSGFQNVCNSVLSPDY
ncbi:hypothetical protein CAPTEDRAFT_190866 [Capitella teleta]|uniref:Uncharacterized protein n=1 Tax=Capitella teleta TaxID=283909 RepID=R7VL46_CAPTE|nr:hypothetical protein CAPTEDRAFT_190866 [Capitella teleta]|eukprot:ELU17951.1 hypothetical protein CAPTEDRAFT_190866 [Capitella teleta]